MAFRVLIAGGRRYSDYGALRAALDVLLAERMPDVELLTAGGPGAAMLAASYATSRGLPVAALVPEFGRFPEPAAVARRDAELVRAADAAVIVWPGRDPDARQLLALVRAKGIPVHIIDPAAAVKVRAVKDADAEPERRGLPD